MKNRGYVGALAAEIYADKRDSKQLMMGHGNKEFESIQKCLDELNLGKQHPHSFIGSTLSDFTIIRELGRGSYGVVYLARPTGAGSGAVVEFCVLKKIDLQNMKQRQQVQAMREVQILKKLRHPHIVQFFTSFLENECLYIVMEYAAGGDLQNLIRT